MLIPPSPATRTATRRLRRSHAQQPARAALTSQVSDDLRGGVTQLLALLPELVASARAQDDDWLLIALSPVGLEDFYGLCEPAHVPGLYRGRMPAGLRAPLKLGTSGWTRIGPTFHAFGWLYRAPLMRALLRAVEQRTPPLNPVDVWVWEVLAQSGALDHALAPRRPLVGTGSTPGGADSLRAATGRQGGVTT
jgi:hypothetical protein